MITREDVIKKFESILDPEVAIDIWTMGLIYEFNIECDKISIVMTLTSPACPLGPMIENNIRHGMSELGFREIIIKLTFEPAWQIPERLRNALGI